MDYNRARMLANIYTIAKAKNVKIGDLESAAGVSTGYISRLAKDENKGALTVEVLVGIAQRLDVTLDALVLTDNGHLSQNEMEMLRFLDKVTVDTECYDLEWNLFDPRTQDDSYLCDHPLFRIKDDGYEEDDNGRPHYFKYTQYESRFLPPKEASINGNCYYALIDDFSNSSIYVMRLTVSGRSRFENETVYEIYFIDHNDNVSPVLCSKITHQQISDAVERLYLAIEGARSHLTISTHTKSIMGRYLARDVSSQQKSKSDDELPF